MLETPAEPRPDFQFDWPIHRHVIRLLEFALQRANLLSAATERSDQSRAEVVPTVCGSRANPITQITCVGALFEKLATICCRRKCVTADVATGADVSE